MKPGYMQEEKEKLNQLRKDLETDIQDLEARLNSTHQMLHSYKGQLGEVEGMLWSIEEMEHKLAIADKVDN
jgi:hypothetical protein